MNSPDHYRDFPTDRVIEWEEHLRNLLEARFTPPTAEQLRAESERRARAAETTNNERTAQ